jgi:hypothetical protein
VYYIRLMYHKGVDSPVWASPDASLHRRHRGALLLDLDEQPPEPYQIVIEHDPERALWSTLIEAWADEPALANPLVNALDGLRAVVHRTAMYAYRGDEAASEWCRQHVSSTASLWPRLEAADTYEHAAFGNYESADVAAWLWTGQLRAEWLEWAEELERRRSHNAAAAMFKGAVAKLMCIFVPITPRGLNPLWVPVSVPRFGWRRAEDHPAAVKAVVNAALFGVLAQLIATTYGATVPDSDDPVFIARAVANDTRANIPQLWRDQLKLVEKPDKLDLLEEHSMVMLARRITEEAVRAVCLPWPNQE